MKPEGDHVASLASKIRRGVLLVLCVHFSFLRWERRVKVNAVLNTQLVCLSVWYAEHIGMNFETPKTTEEWLGFTLELRAE